MMGFLGMRTPYRRSFEGDGDGLGEGEGLGDGLGELLPDLNQLIGFSECRMPRFTLRTTSRLLMRIPIWPRHVVAHARARSRAARPPGASRRRSRRGPTPPPRPASHERWPALRPALPEETTAAPRAAAAVAGPAIGGATGAAGSLRQPPAPDLPRAGGCGAASRGRRAPRSAGADPAWDRPPSSAAVCPADSPRPASPAAVGRSVAGTPIPEGRDRDEGGGQQTCHADARAGAPSSRRLTRRPSGWSAWAKAAAPAGVEATDAACTSTSQ